MLLLSMGTEEPFGTILLRRPQNWTPTNAAQQHQAHPGFCFWNPPWNSTSWCAVWLR